MSGPPCTWWQADVLGAPDDQRRRAQLRGTGAQVVLWPGEASPLCCPGSHAVGGSRASGDTPDDFAVEYEGHCGSAGLCVDADQHCATHTIGVFVPGLRGQGLGREITRLVLDWAFGVLGVHRVELGVLASNSRAIGCYRACGFRQEASAARPGSTPDGWKDFILMAVLQPEYASVAWDTPASGPDPA